MIGLKVLNTDDIVITIEFLARLSELVKCTLAGFGLNVELSKYSALSNFEYCFVNYFPEGDDRLDDLPYEKMFTGKHSIMMTSIYKRLLEVYIQNSEFRMPPLVEPPVGYGVIEKELKRIDKDLDLLIQKIKRE